LNISSNAPRRGSARLGPQAVHSAVLLLAHGTPSRIEEIPAFLRNVTGGRPVPQAVVDEVTRRYERIGRSPLRELTFRQAEMLERELGLPVYVGMRNWTPFVPEVVREMAAAGVQHAVVICLAPQNSRTSVGLYKQALFGEPGAPFAIDFVESWHDHPLLIRAFAEKLQAGLRRAQQEASAECKRAAGPVNSDFGLSGSSEVPVIFTAHSVPTRTITDGDPYEQQARQTAELVARQAGLPAGSFHFAFQSQGSSGGAWLGPTVEEIIRALRQQGRRAVFVQPIGFLCDHVEVLYDIDIAFKAFAEEQGMRLWRAESLNDSPLLAAALADVARSRLERATPVQVHEAEPE
jgi:ferrochelatase